MISVILQSWKGLKPQDKVVYLHWMWCTREQRDVFLSIASLAEKLKMKETTVRGSVARLYASDKVIFNNEQSSYAVVYSAVFDSAQVQSEEKLASILAMLGIGTALIGERAEVLAKRLLRAVLVSLTDELGVIESISFAHLSKVTGMTKQRLRRYINELVANGFVLKFVTGGNAPTLYKKSSSICIIDSEVFGGGRIALQGFQAEELLGCNPNQALGKGIYRKQIFDVSEINRHQLAGRLYHFFDELVSQRVRDKLTKEYSVCSRKIIASTDQEKVNHSIKSRWAREIDLFSDFVLMIIHHQVAVGTPSPPLDVYFIRVESSCYVLSNFGKAYSGKIEMQSNGLVAFKSGELCWEL
ncbi:TPA: hypothetical protein NJ365_003224 [Vibrio parahaemolyticus]|nr:hypothetical protein [Vibrio parahaemolyticus]